MSYTIPSDTHSPGDPTGHTTDHNRIVDVLKGSGAALNVLNTAYSGGADPTGVSDSAAAINAALTAAASGGGGAVYLPPGTYKIGSTLTVPGGVALTGPPAAVNTAPTGPDVMPAIIKLANAANTHMVSIGGNNAYAGNLELDGNKANQSTAFGNGVLYNGWNFAVLERLFIHDQFFRGINMVSGVGGRVLNCSAGNNRDAGIYMDSGSTDNTILATYVNNNATDGVYSAGFVNRLIGCDVWNNSNNGIKVDSGGRAVMIIGCGIDHNQQHGIVIKGPGVSVIGCTLHSNGLQTTNTYHSIIVDNSGSTVDSAAITGNSFWLDGGVTNKVAYHISYSGTVVAKAHGNGFQASSSATGTISAASAAKDANETG